MIGTGVPFGWYLDNITFTNFLTLTNQIVTSVPGGTNFVFTPSQAGNYLIEARAVTFGPSYMPYGAPLTVAAGVNSGPLLVYSMRGDTLTLSWSDPTFTMRQTPGLAPAAWVSLNSNSPAVITINPRTNSFYRLEK
jgi:hypothetical protein